MTDAPPETLYARLGEDPAINAAVEMLYSKIMLDKTLYPFFRGVNMNMLYHHMKLFLTDAFGGTSKYTGRELRDAHKQLVLEKGLNDTHFDSVAKHLKDTLVRFKVSDEIIEEVLTIVETTRDDVLNK